MFVSHVSVVFSTFVQGATVQGAMVAAGTGLAEGVHKVGQDLSSLQC